MSWFESASASAIPGAEFLLLLLGLPILVFGLVKLLVLPLSVWFELRAARRRRRETPTLLDEWPSVSIIVPAFNEATVIENCVRSIQLTRYDRYEVVLVDDGSTDNTAELMHGTRRFGSPDHGPDPGQRRQGGRTEPGHPPGHRRGPHVCRRGRDLLPEHGQADAPGFH